MSKIIKEGELPVKRVKCDYCGCKFEYDKRDVIEGTESQHAWQGALCDASLAVRKVYSVACPYCHTEHRLPADILDQLKAANPIKDFAEDAKTLAAQYGLEIEEITLRVCLLLTDV